MKVFATFDSCHSGGMIRDDEIAEGAREVEPDDRPNHQSQDLMRFYKQYDWLIKVQNNEEIPSAFKKCGKSICMSK